MSEPGKADRWNSLLENLGVPVSEPKPPQPAPESSAADAPAAPRPQPVSLLRPEKPKATPKPKPPQPAKSPSYWSRIAGALGLEVAAEPEPSAPSPAENIAETDVASAPEIQPEPPPREFRREPESARDVEMPPRAFERPVRAERPEREIRPTREQRTAREERPHHDRPHSDRPRHAERQRSSEPAPRSSLDEIFGSKPADLDVFGLGIDDAEAPRVREPVGGSGRGDYESGPVIDYEAPEGSGSDLPPGAPEPLGFERADEESSEREGQRRRRRRRGRGRRGSGGEDRAPAPPRHEADIEPAGEEADFDFDRDAEINLDAEMGDERVAPDDRPQRGQRRERDPQADRYPVRAERPARGTGDERGGRRRRRGSRDRDESATPAPYGAQGEPAPRHSPPRDQRPAAENDIDDDLADDLGTEADDADVGASGDLPTHRRIPTWNEAVGILIDANMANRGPDRDRDRDRGRHRGRGRGR